MPFANDDIYQIVQTICQSVLELDAVLMPDLRNGESNPLAACVHITGGWQGTLVLSSSHGFALQAAARMFQTAAADCSDIELQDAVAELTNMIGGNFKALIVTDSPCQLSLPAVVAGSRYSARVPGAQAINRLSLRCGNQALQITVLQRTTSIAAA